MCVLEVADAAGVFLGSPVAGIAANEIIDGTPALRRVRREWGVLDAGRGLPRGFTTAISGSPCQDVLHEAADVSFIGVRHPVLGPGFDVRVGAGLAASPVSVGPVSAGRLGAFAALDEVPEVWSAIVRAFLDRGCRRPDPRDRLAWLAAGRGAGEFRRLIEDGYLHRRLADGPAPASPAGPRDHVGVHPQRDGRCYVGATPAVARVTGASREALAGLAAAHGSHRVRITPYGKPVVLDIAPERVESFCRGLEGIGLTARPMLSRRRDAVRVRGCAWCA
jgi:sulfite reductase (ferredoxin)